MGSLNGDVVVMRNGRSTSQVSIYNYPEHLNPFYEEDQHKRLRFWKISKKDGETRRNSFSIGNLRDIWAFKPFRLKKKSSTLGINKTSESPPPLRREYVIDNGWNSFDHRLRASNTSSINGDSFQRNAGYRSSLQTLPSNDRIGLNRNDDYRSTIQVPRAYPRFHHQQKPQVQPRRSSQSSMASTNPFESDMDDDNDDTNTMRSMIGGSSSTLSKSTPRKKRRAPAPPTPVRGRSDRAVTPTIVIESSQDDTPNELCIREDTDIANLTAEIESFVKNTSNDDIETSMVIVEKKVPKSTGTETTMEPSAKEALKTTTTSASKTADDAKGAINSKREEITPPKENSRQEPLSSDPLKEATHIEIETTTSSKKSTLTSPTSDREQKRHENVKEIVQVNTETVANSSHDKPKITETMTVTKVTKTSKASESKAPVNDQTSTSTKGVKEIISNGAIPKRSNANQLSAQKAGMDNVELSIEENRSQQQNISSSVNCGPKQEKEVGHVECIHVHVESPRPTARENHVNKVSSFKNEPIAEVITTKTPFILTSPPRQRKVVQENDQTKETAKLLQSPKSMVTHELQIQEERVKPKPEVMEKPTLSPKPIVERKNNEHLFAEIHKPTRNKISHSSTSSVHARRTSRDEIVIPPTVPRQQLEEPPASSVSNSTNVDQAAAVDPKKSESLTTNLKIEESLEASANGHVNNTPEFIPHLSPEPQVSSSVPHSTVDIDGNSANAHFDPLYRPQTHMEWKRSTLAPLETNIPPEKRKSVKDIIESINRSQRLLHAAANKDFTIVPALPSPSGENGDENQRILEESQREIRRMVYQIDHLEDNCSGSEAVSNGAMALSASPPPSYSECVGAQKPDNSEIFQKCKVQKDVYDYRESSPISSNLDWNPVPKPKRTKPQYE
uniref:Uncharacterized protein n=1 Tax=Stomoxys calcitrans TaxID=35570 RepID=A0A1I8PM49_STOCA